MLHLQKGVHSKQLLANPCHLAHHALRLFCCQRFLLPGLLTPKGLHIEGQARQMQVPPHPHKNQMQVRLGVVCNHPLRDSDHSPPKALVVLTCSEYLSVILCDAATPRVVYGAIVQPRFICFPAWRISFNESIFRPYCQCASSLTVEYSRKAINGYTYGGQRF